MANLKCKMCGGELNIVDEATVCECEYCGSKQTVPTIDNEKKSTFFDRANRLRMKGEFDKAAGVYETIVAEFPEEAEGYWGLCLCKYGIEYVDDPTTGKKIPTCHRTSFESIFKDENFDLAQEYADMIATEQYRTEAKEIDRLQKAILEIVEKEEPYDIFICYKDTDENGERTKDSVRAQEIYTELTKEGYKVFFSRITLEDKLGIDYEPYIFSALNSAKIMLAIGTKYNYYNAIWVKNEWSRFLELMKKDSSKKLIPCYSDIDAYDMPDEFSNLQGLDMTRIGFLQDLVRGINKILGTEETKENKPSETVIASDGLSVAPLLERAFMFLEDGEWESADEYCEKVLDRDPKNANAYLGKLMAENRAHTMEDLKNCSRPFDNSSNYHKAIRFSEIEVSDTLTSYVKYIKEKNEEARKNEIYNSANELSLKDDYEAVHKAVDKYKSIPGWKDSDSKLAELLKVLKEEEQIIELEKEYQLKYESLLEAKDEKIQELNMLKDSLAFYKPKDKAIVRVSIGAGFIIMFILGIPSFISDITNNLGLAVIYGLFGITGAILLVFGIKALKKRVAYKKDLNDRIESLQKEIDSINNNIPDIHEYIESNI